MIKLPENEKLRALMERGAKDTVIGTNEIVTQYCRALNQAGLPVKEGTPEIMALSGLTTMLFEVSKEYSSFDSSAGAALESWRNRVKAHFASYED